MVKLLMQDNGFSDRMKFYESFETDRRFLPTLPVYARIDGRGFSKFTKGMERPYDVRMSQAMIETTKHLVAATHAKIGYIQSDEISLVWKAIDHNSDIFFSGKIQKMTSVLASMATAAFTRAILDSELAPYAARMPHFDCRVISFPNVTEATNMILWRTADATKNAVSMAARHYYSHSQLHRKSGPEMQEMLFAKGINFNDYPPFFKRGVFVRRHTEFRKLSEETIAKLQIAGKDTDPDRLYERSVVAELEMPIFSQVSNREQVVFDGQMPFTTC